MSALQKGDTLRDNDPRLTGRTLVVESLDAGFAYLKASTGRSVRVRLNRIHTDDKPRRTGFSRIEASQP